MMMQGNLEADRCIKLTRDLVEPRRFPGIAAREGLTAKRSRPEMALQRLEKIESAPGNGMGSEASNPQDVVHGRAADRARLRPTSLGNDEAKFSASQPVEIAQSREGISEAAPRISPPRSYEEGSVVGLLGTRGRGSGGLPKRSAPPSRAGGGECGKVKGNFSPPKSIKTAQNRKKTPPPPPLSPPPVLRGRGWGRGW